MKEDEALARLGFVVGFQHNVKMSLAAEDDSLASRVRVKVEKHWLEPSMIGHKLRTFSLFKTSKTSRSSSKIISKCVCKNEMS